MAECITTHWPTERRSCGVDGYDDDAGVVHVCGEPVGHDGEHRCSCLQTWGVPTPEVSSS